MWMLSKMSKRNVGLPTLPPPGPPVSQPDAFRRRADELALEAQDLIRGKQTLTPAEMTRFKAIINEMHEILTHPANIIPGLDGGRRRSLRRNLGQRTRKHRKHH